MFVFRFPGELGPKQFAIDGVQVALGDRLRDARNVCELFELGDALQ
jgi:hypothetical protein